MTLTEWKKSADEERVKIERSHERKRETNTRAPSRLSAQAVNFRLFKEKDNKNVVRQKGKEKVR